MVSWIRVLMDLTLYLFHWEFYDWLALSTRPDSGNTLVVCHQSGLDSAIHTVGKNEFLWLIGPWKDRGRQRLVSDYIISSKAVLSNSFNIKTLVSNIEEVHNPLSNTSEIQNVVKTKWFYRTHLMANLTLIQVEAL